MDATCPRCRNINPAGAQFCNYCGSPMAGAQPQPPPPPPGPPPPPHYGPPQPPYGPPYPPPPPPGGGGLGSDKALLALILGIVTVIGCGPITGIPGMIIAKGEMAAIQQGRAPAQNMDKAKWGWYLSLGGTILSVVCLCVWMALGSLSMMPYRF